MSAATPTESVINLTESAAGQIRHLVESNSENTGKHLRVYVEQGGCSGKQYGMVFDEKRPEDLFVEMHGVTVLVDPVSAGHIQGSILDFNDGLNASGFKITNPNARQSCGCGKSFEA
ncbi:MAG TPA: iron-sulfur cluster assembly accessory protein [Verrucomicrobiae bacterium]|jgi:iron-sulfur cluster assembly protein/iron-sulfur cluster insertion protein|nr:iron-sulfur cluster assembly accessory protein [Verrucomicrobiae bacterium]